MGKVAIVLAIGFIGFMIGDGGFSAKMVNAFNWLNTLSWIGAVILGILGAVFFFGGTFVGATAGHDAGKGIGAIFGSVGGGVLGAIFAVVVMVVPVANIMLTYEIMELIPKDAETFSHIFDSAAAPFIYIWGTILLFTGFMKSEKSN